VSQTSHVHLRDERARINGFERVETSPYSHLLNRWIPRKFLVASFIDPQPKRPLLFFSSHAPYPGFFGSRELRESPRLFDLVGIPFLERLGRDADFS